ncbi:hypothetical protein G7054_g10092 [Neopestalotiopsis clavispora]|nr:hypothetical protein G7054_g10092 [Neopestalotiopsis clavispora]
MASQNSPSTGPSFAIRRRPVSIAHRSPAQQSLPSPSSQLPSPQPLPQLFEFQDFGIDSQQQSTNNAPGCSPIGAANSNHTSDLPTPPPSASPRSSPSSQSSPELLKSPVFFPAPEIGSLPTPPPSARPEQSYFSPPPSSAERRAPEPTPSVPPRPSNPTSTTYQSGPAPAGPRPAFSPSASSSSNGASADTSTPHPVYRSNTRRIRDGLNRYINTDTARRAYSNGVELLGKTSERMGRIIDPLMPVLSVANPEFASTYQQISQAGGQGSILPLMGALAQVTMNNNTEEGNTATGQPFLDMLNQQQATLGASGGGFDPSSFIAALAQNSTSDANADAINSYIQQQSDANMAALQASMANVAGGVPSQNPFLDLLAAAQSGSSAQLMEQIMLQQQQQQQAALANLAAWGSVPTNINMGDPLGPASFAQEATASDGSAAAGQSPDFTAPEAQNGQSSSVPPPQTEASPGDQDQRPEATWTRQSIPKFGIRSISLPANHNLRLLGHNVLAAELSDLSGYFEIQLLYSSRQVVDEMASMQQLRSDQDVTLLEPCAMTDFGIPCGGVSVSCALVINEPDDEGKTPAMYRVIVQSPYGHGLSLSYFVAAEHLHAVKTVAKTQMVSSISWIDRGTICDSIAQKLVGKWRWAEDMSLIDLGDGFEREWKQLTFTADGRYEYQKSGGNTTGVAPGIAQTQPEAGHMSGRFEVFEYKDGPIHLTLTEDRSSGVEVQEILLSGSAITVKEKVYHKIMV